MKLLLLPLILLTLTGCAADNSSYDSAVRNLAVCDENLQQCKEEQTSFNNNTECQKYKNKLVQELEEIYGHLPAYSFDSIFYSPVTNSCLYSWQIDNIQKDETFLGYIFDYFTRNRVFDTFDSLEYYNKLEEYQNK